MYITQPLSNLYAHIVFVSTDAGIRIFYAYSYVLGQQDNHRCSRATILVLLSLNGRDLSPYMGFSKIRGPILGRLIRSHTKDHSMFGSIWRPLIFGNSHVQLIYGLVAFTEDAIWATVNMS